MHLNTVVSAEQSKQRSLTACNSTTCYDCEPGRALEVSTLSTTVTFQITAVTAASQTALWKNVF